MPTRKEVDKLGEPIISRGPRRGLQSTEKFPWEKENPQREQRGLTESQEERLPAQKVRE